MDLISQSITHFLVKEYLFALTSAVGDSIQLNLAMINKTSASCTRVKLMVDQHRTFPNSVLMDIEYEIVGVTQTEIIQIKYDHVPKYFNDCKC